jgi:hypothetical protein
VIRPSNAPLHKPGWVGGGGGTGCRHLSVPFPHLQSLPIPRMFKLFWALEWWKDKIHISRWKMSSIKNWPVEGLCGSCLFVRVCRLDKANSVAPLSFSLVQLSPPPPPFPLWISILYIRIQCVRREGIWGSQGDHILQEFNIQYLTNFRTYQIARSHQAKTLEGRGPQKNKHLPQKSLYRSIVLVDDILHCLLWVVLSSSLLSLSVEYFKFSTHTDHWSLT